MARAASSPRYCVPPGGQAGRRSRPFLRRLLRAISRQLAQDRDSGGAATATIAPPRFSTFCRAKRARLYPRRPRRPRRCAGISRAWKRRRRRSTRPRRRTARRAGFKEFYDGATSWSRVERVIARVEVGTQRSRTRAFVVTNLQQRNAPSALRGCLLPARSGREPHQILEDPPGGRSHVVHQGKRQPIAAVPARGPPTGSCGGLRVSMPKRSMWRVAQFDTLRLRLIKGRRAGRRVEDHDPRASADIVPPCSTFFHYVLGRIPRLKIPRFVT